jgi:hypothetical protein
MLRFNRRRNRPAFCLLAEPEPVSVVAEQADREEAANVLASLLCLLTAWLYSQRHLDHLRVAKRARRVPPERIHLAIAQRRHS